MRIVTISREFGSGGRELGKRLADLLECDYYDKEIITAIAVNQNLDEEYVARTLDNHGWENIPLSFRHTFISSMTSMQIVLLIEQKKIIEQIAKTGKDCVIVGRNADVLLAEYNPFNIFVCADMDAKVRRCFDMADKNENLSRKDVERKIRSIDKNRSQTREMITESKWGDRASYHLVVNTTDWTIKELAPAVKAFMECWFRRENEHSIIRSL
ncbi:MAG: cytidylate kinase-like family protein [Clostridiales bacterium]|nr:cytidylate kinase-like family protein [Clostridiales bacterium]